MGNTEKRMRKISFAELVLGIGLLFVGIFHEYLACAVSVVMLVWLLYRSVKTGQLCFYCNLTSVSILCIAAFYGLTALWAVDSGVALVGFVKFVPVVLYLFVLFGDGDADGILSRLPYMAAVMTAVSAVGMQIPALADYFSVAGRLAGFFQYSNTFALFLLVAELLVVSKEKLRPLDFLLLAVLLFGILYSGSRTVFLLTVLSNAVLLFCTKKGRTRLIAAAVVAVLIAGVLVYALIFGKTGVLGRFLTISLSESTFVGRLLYFRDALPLILRHPFGLGYMGYYYMQQSVQSGVYSVMFVHNDFLQLLLDVGWLPTLLFVAAIGKAVFGGKRPLYKRVILCVMFLHSCFDFDLQFGAIFMLLLLLIDDKTGKAVSLNRKLMGSAAAVLTVVCLYFGTALSLSHFGNYAAAVSLYPADTRSETRLLVQESDRGKAGEIADRILRRNTHVTVAYSVKARQAYATGDFAKLIEIKRSIFENAPFAYDEYEEYCYMLITGVRLYREAGDDASAQICLQELRRTAEMVHTAASRLSDLGKKIKDQPTVRLPDDIEQYLKTEVDAD